MSKITPRFSLYFFVLLILGGGLATLYGFYDVINAQTPVLWKWSFYYLTIFIILFAIISIIGIWVGAYRSVAIVGLFCIIGLGGLIPLSVVLFLAASMYVLGRLILRAQGIHATDSLIVGMVVLGFCLCILVHFPVNTPGTWGVLFALPLFFGRRYLAGIVPKNICSAPVSSQLYFLQCSIGAIAMLHVFVGLMPEIGHDALAMHLFIPGYVLQNQKWSFDVTSYCWAVMPMFVNWIYTAGYFFAGEAGARLTNIGSILLLSSLVYRVAIWAKASKEGACWATLLFLSTPLTFLESSSLFVDGTWGVFVIAGTLALLRMLASSASLKIDILLSGIFLGGALASKAITFTMLPVLALTALIFYRKWFSKELIKSLITVIAVFFIVGLFQYVIAYLKTGNPLFPFYNDIFKSPLFQTDNFKDLRWQYGLTWDLLYSMTFNCHRYLEGTLGSSGFYWLLLLVPSIVILIFCQQWRGIGIICIALGFILITFNLTAYLRYIFVSFGMICSAIGVAFSCMVFKSKWNFRIMAAVLLACFLLNLIHFNAATWYGAINFDVISDLNARNKYIIDHTPTKKAANIVNELNNESSPVAFFSSPEAAGLKSDALYTNWYNPRFMGFLDSIDTPESFIKKLSDYNVKYLVFDPKNSNQKNNNIIISSSKEVYNVGNVSIRKIDNPLLYTEALISPNGFDGAWRFDSRATVLPDKSVKVTVESSGYISVPIQPKKKYRYIAEASGADLPARGRLQVNWLNSIGKIVHVDIQVFESTPQFTEYTMDLTAPADATTAVVYASGHEKKPVVFKKVLFLK
jgi:hypothetical protein